MNTDNSIELLFFELIRISLGNEECLSHSPTSEEWHMLFSMAKKQSLIGICFAGVNKLSQQKQNIPQKLYHTWLGMATMIQQRNEIVNRQCSELQRKLSDDGERFCILKGQAAGIRYSNGLNMLRHPGDIDVWMTGGQMHVLEYVNKFFPTNAVTGTHVQFNLFDVTKVELHYVPIRLFNRYANRRLQKWLRTQEETQLKHSIPFGEGILNVPTDEFDLVYMLLHIYKHFFNEGVGLRQLMDYYFLLSKVNVYNKSDIIYNSNRLFQQFGTERFAAALMYVESVVFGLQEKYFLCSPDAKAGQFLLHEILQMGNFGHNDTRFKLQKKDSHFRRFLMMCSSKWRFIDLFPKEAAWQSFDTFFRFFELRHLQKRISR